MLNKASAARRTNNQMKIETFYLQNCGWDYMVLNEEDFNTKTPTGYWFHTEAEAVADARACYPEVTEFALSDTNEDK
jgi:hypothetical protein